MGYEPIDTNESYQIDENGKVIDSILRSVEPETDEKGPFINTNNGKVYIADKLEELHGEGAAKAYTKRFNAEQDAINANRELSDTEVTEGGEVVDAEDTDTPQPKEGGGTTLETTSEEEEAEDPKETASKEEKEVSDKDLSPDEKVQAVKEYFDENGEVTYDTVKEGLAEVGINVNDQHVAKGKKEAGLRG